MADPILDPWQPHWLPTPDGLDPAYKPGLDALFADVHPSDQIPGDHPIDVSGLGLPDHIVQAAMGAPNATPNLGELPPDYVGDPTQGPVTQPQAFDAGATPGPVTSPDGAPGDQFIPPPIPSGPVTQPDAPPPSVRDLLDPENPNAVGSVRMEQPGELFVNDPLSNPNQEEGQRQLAQMAATDPARFIAYQNEWIQKRTQKFASDQIAAEQENQRKAEQDYKDRQEAEAATQKKMDALYAQAASIPKVNPDRYMANRSAGRRVLDLIGAIAGGIQGGSAGNNSGRNVYLESMQHDIDQDIDAQKADIMSQREGINTRRSMLSDEFARTGNLYQAAEAVRIASYGSVLRTLQAQQQLYDPAGTTAMNYAGQIMDWQGRIQQHTEKLAATQLKNEIDLREQSRKELDTAMTARKNLAEIDKIKAETAKLQGASGGGVGAAGSPTNPKYTVPTGFFDPFSKEPIYGKRQIGGKGEDPKERAGVDASIRTYGHVQDYWAQLAKVGAEVGYAKSLGESVWSKRKDTLGAEYDAAREALTVYLTKELGDKLTQGQLEAQAHRIPERASVFEARDPGKQISDAQSDADRDFTRDMNLVGIDATPIVANARHSRAAAPVPKSDDAITAANEAVSRATTPGQKKDSLAALDAAKAQKAAELEQKKTGESAITEAEKDKPTKPTDQQRPPMVSPAMAAQWSAVDDAIDTYNQRLTQYQGLHTKKGVTHEQLVDAAMKLAEAKRGIDAATLEANTFTKNHNFSSSDLPDEAPKFK